MELLPKLPYFASKSCSRVLGLRQYIRKRDSLRKYLRGYRVYMINRNPLVGHCLQCVKEPTNKVDKNAAVVVRTNSHRKEDVVDQVQQKSPLLYLCSYPCSITLWTPLQLRIRTGIRARYKDWKSQRIFIVMDLKRSLNKLKNKVTEIKENLNETVKHCLK